MDDIDSGETRGTPTDIEAPGSAGLARSIRVFLVTAGLGLCTLLAIQSRVGNNGGVEPTGARPHGRDTRHEAQAATVTADIAPAVIPVTSPVEETEEAVPDPVDRENQELARTVLPVPSERSIRIEIEIIEAIKKEISEGHYAQALDGLDEHARSYPNGVFVEERAALRGVSMCGLGQRERGLAVAEKLSLRRSNLPLVTEIRRACAPEIETEPMKLPLDSP